MPLFAHIETRNALDVYENVDPKEYVGRFASDVILGWEISEVPEGTIHNALKNSDGTYTNPVVVVPDTPEPAQPTLGEIKAKLAEITALVNAL